MVLPPHQSRKRPPSTQAVWDDITDRQTGVRDTGTQMLRFRHTAHVVSQTVGVQRARYLRRVGLRFRVAVLRGACWNASTPSCKPTLGRLWGIPNYSLTANREFGSSRQQKLTTENFPCASAFQPKENYAEAAGFIVVFFDFPEQQLTKTMRH